MSKNKLLVILTISIFIILGSVLFIQNRDTVFTGETSDWNIKYKINDNHFRSLDLKYKNKIKNNKRIEYICKVFENGDEITLVEDRLTIDDDKISIKSYIPNDTNFRKNKYSITIKWADKIEEISLH